MITFTNINKNDRLYKLVQQGIVCCKECDLPISKDITFKYSSAERKHGSCKYDRLTGHFIISVSKNIKYDGDMLNTVIHELLHTCPVCQNHGTLWQAYANVINARYGIKITRCSKKEHIRVDVGSSRRQYFTKMEYVDHVAHGGDLLVAVGCVGETEPSFFIKKTSKIIQNLSSYTAHGGKKLVIMRY